MPLEAAKAIFEVHAGVIPGQPMPEYTRRWGYTSTDYQHDRSVPEGEDTIFTTRLKEAHAYAMSITSPAYVNWVNVHWIWI